MKKCSTGYKTVYEPTLFKLYISVEFYVYIVFWKDWY